MSSQTDPILDFFCKDPRFKIQEITENTHLLRIEEDDDFRLALYIDEGFTYGKALCFQYPGEFRIRLLEFNAASLLTNQVYLYSREIMEDIAAGNLELLPELTECYQYLRHRYRGSQNPK